MEVLTILLVVVGCGLGWLLCGALAGAWTFRYIGRYLPKVRADHEEFWFEVAMGQVVLGPIALALCVYYYGLRRLPRV